MNGNMGANINVLVSIRSVPSKQIPFVATYSAVGHVTGWFHITGWFLDSCSLKLNLKVHLPPLQCSSYIQASGRWTRLKTEVPSSPQIFDLSHQLLC